MKAVSHQGQTAVISFAWTVQNGTAEMAQPVKLLAVQTDRETDSPSSFPQTHSRRELKVTL